MPVKVHRIVLMIVDHDGVGADEVRQVIENANYPNDCISPQVAVVETREVEWDDAHPLNQRFGWLAQFDRLFDYSKEKA